MTGEKNRYTTTEKLWDLDDKTLKTPAHDEMVLWLLNKTNILSLFPEVEHHHIDIISENPLTAENGFLVGYLDITIELTPYYSPDDDPLATYKYIEVKPTISSFGSTLRQLNTYIHYIKLKNRRFLGGHKIPIEMYLFTADLRFKEAFESQRIKVLTYPDQ